jgi:hypothetical protein
MTAAVADKNRIKGFIVGCPRSGTTLMATILDRHSAVAVPPETQFGAFLDKNRDLLKSAPADRESAFDQLVGRLNGWNRFTDLQLPLENFRARLVCGEPTVRHAFDSLLMAYLQNEQKEFCIEKSPEHLFFAETLSRWYPQARFLHLIRDGRDVSVSLRDCPFSRMPLRHGCLHWKRCLAQAKSLERALGERWLNVRMEDLVFDPESVVQTIMRFFGLAFEPGQLAATVERNVYRSWEQAWKGDTQGGIDPRKVGRFRAAASPQEIRMMEMLLAHELRAKGYASCNLPTTMPRRIALSAWAYAFSVGNSPGVKRWRAKLKSWPVVGRRAKSI